VIDNCLEHSAVSLLVSIGVLQTPGVSGGIPGTPAVYRVTINRRLSDACLIDRIAGMGWFDWLAGDAFWFQSVSCWRLSSGGSLHGSHGGLLVWFNRWLFVAFLLDI